jgi:hypothetical protein
MKPVCETHLSALRDMAIDHGLLNPNVSLDLKTTEGGVIYVGCISYEPEPGGPLKFEFARAETPNEAIDMLFAWLSSQPTSDKRHIERALDLARRVTVNLQQIAGGEEAVAKANILIATIADLQREGVADG